MSDVMKLVKQIQRMYEERNKLFEESGLGDYIYSDAEIEKYMAEAIEKEISVRLEKAVKDSGL
ncbi:MAG: hypothetical protein GOVbin1782_98 [Prokaryotic dsDNA virus sp.]|nr:MAG: hypothetical protein GOVbin1782_98 [Prokaryotic dsDNA virus sp.]